MVGLAAPSLLVVGPFTVAPVRARRLDAHGPATTAVCSSQANSPLWQNLDPLFELWPETDSREWLEAVGGLPPVTAVRPAGVSAGLAARRRSHEATHNLTNAAHPVDHEVMRRRVVRPLHLPPAWDLHGLRLEPPPTAPGSRTGTRPSTAVVDFAAEFLDAQLPGPLGHVAADQRGNRLDAGASERDEALDTRSARATDEVAVEVLPPHDLYQPHVDRGFADWRLAVDGLVARPGELSIVELKDAPSRSHITMLGCEKGWSYIAEWTGVPLAHVLERVGVLRQARYVAMFSMAQPWWGSIDIAEAMHPQTLLAYGMNGADLAPGYGAPIRLRVPVLPQGSWTVV